MLARVTLSISLAVLVAFPAASQSTSSRTAKRARAVAGKIVDTTATTVATMAADSLLGTGAGAMQQALSAAQMAEYARQAQMAGMAQAGAVPNCAPGTMPVPMTLGGGAARGMSPVAAAAAAVPTIPTPGGILVGVAKRKLLGFGRKKDATPNPDSAARAAAAASAQAAALAGYQCMTPAQVQAYVQSQRGDAQEDAMKKAAATALAVSPAGMMVAGAAAAAPTAGKALHALGKRFGRGQRDTVPKP